MQTFKLLGGKPMSYFRIPYQQCIFPTPSRVYISALSQISKIPSSSRQTQQLSKRSFFSYDRPKKNHETSLLDAPDIVHPVSEEVTIVTSAPEPKTQLQMQMQTAPTIARVRTRTALREREQDPPAS